MKYKNLFKEEKCQESHRQTDGGHGIEVICEKPATHFYLYRIDGESSIVVYRCDYHYYRKMDNPDAEISRDYFETLRIMES